MNYRQKTLLAGIAALALAGGTGLAPAQEPSQQQQSKQPHATQQMNQAPTGKVEQNRGAATQQPNQRAQENSAQENSAHDNNRPNKTDKSVTEEQRKGQNAAPGERNGAAAQRQNGDRKDDNTAARREHNGMEGLQGNASGMHAKLTDEQRTRIRDTVIRASGAPRVGRVDFDVTVGTVVPRDGIRIIPVPETLVQIEPEWRGFLYFVYEDELVVVDPSDMKIVAVVPA
jgi:uncharacterized protein DUF1236